jgi:CubicO group peptidase (beta-lactamase class C family)
MRRDHSSLGFWPRGLIIEAPNMSLQRTLVGSFQLLLMLAAAACDPSVALEKPESWAERLRDKPWQTWSHEEIQWGLGRYDQIWDTRVVPAGSSTRPLETGPSISGFESGSAGGAELDRYLKEQSVAGLLILQDGRIRLERYAFGHTERDRWTSQSVGKSVTSTLVGVALREGHIKSLDDAVSQYIDGLRGSAYDQVSVRQLLTMTSGVRWSEDYSDLDSDLHRLYSTRPAPGLSVASTYLRTLERETAPGDRWVYNTGETHLLGDLVRAATGTTLSDYLSEKIWKPYGMEAAASWVLDETGAEEAGCCLQATLRDFGRFGQFVLDGGRAGDSIVVADDWFADATAPHALIDDDGNGYGYQWWTHADGTISAFGIYGQMIHIDPARKMVVVLNSAWPKALDPDRSAARSTFLAAIKESIDKEAEGR